MFYSKDPNFERRAKKLEEKKMKNLSKLLVERKLLNEIDGLGKTKGTQFSPGGTEAHGSMGA